MRLFQKKFIHYPLVILVIFLCSWYFITNSNSKLVSASEKSIPSVVTISSNNYSFPKNRSGIGSGVIFSKDGYIVTNLHIISGEDINVQLSNGKIFQAKIIGLDKNTDIAILKISPDEDLEPIKFSNSDDLKIGDRVLAIGNPYGIGISVSNGIISATGRDYGNPYLQLIQTDAAINPGNSGGALINEKGNLIGINSKIFSRTGAYQGIGFAIPSNLVVQTATQLIKFGEVKSFWIGNFRVGKVRIKKNNNFIDGLRIIEMENKGPLFEKGVKTNDILVSINNENASWANLTSSLKFATLGENLSMEFINQKGELTKVNFETKI